MEPSSRTLQTNTDYASQACVNHSYNQENLLIKLPMEVIAPYILIDLSPADLARMSLSCRDFKQLSEHNFMWKYLFNKTFIGSIESYDLSLKELYRTTLERTLKTGKEVLQLEQVNNLPINFSPSHTEKKLSKKELAEILNINESTSEGQKVLQKVILNSNTMRGFSLKVVLSNFKLNVDLNIQLPLVLRTINLDLPIRLNIPAIK